MKKIVISFFAIMAAIVGFVYIANIQSVERDLTKLQAPDQGRFNMVRTVCIPRQLARMGADTSMKKIDVDFASYAGTTQQYRCYTKFYHDPRMNFYAEKVCFGRRRPAINEFNYILKNTLNQLPCGINYFYPGIIKDQIENPAKYARYVDSVVEAKHYLQTGERFEEPAAIVSPSAIGK